MSRSFVRRIVLPGESRLDVRWIRPADAALLREGFQRLSAESRRMRFFGAIRELSEPFIRYLTEVDGCDHAALIAVSPPNPLTGKPDRGFGIARFVRNKKDERSAELAVVVTDDFQGRGLGRQLIALLAAAARERSIETFTMSVLRTNGRVRRLLKQVGAELRGGDGLALDYAVPTAALARPLISGAARAAAAR